MRQFKKINFVRRIVQLVFVSSCCPDSSSRSIRAQKPLWWHLAGNFSLQANSVRPRCRTVRLSPHTVVRSLLLRLDLCDGHLGDLLTSIRNGLKIKEHQIGESADSKLKLIKYILL